MNRFERGVLLAVLFVILPASLVFAQSQQKDILEFEPNDTLEEIREKIEHNGYNFTVDHNWVFDMPPEMKREFLSRCAPLYPREHRISDDIGPLEKHLGRSLPSSFDWRSYGGHSYIGDIRDQGACGSCYAFGACAAAEGTYNYAMGLYDSNCANFSEAFVAFCLSDHYSGFDGCSGSDYDYEELDGVVDYGVCNDSVYPYTDVEQACQASSWSAPRVQFSSWHRITCGDVDAIKTAIMTYGVVDAAVYSNLPAFTGYSGGVYEDSNTTCFSSPCYYTPTDHIIALVGWDDTAVPANGYWILRNSWGTSWGESGYMRIKYTSARVACEACYLVYEQAPATPTPAPTATPTPTPALEIEPSDLQARQGFQFEIILREDINERFDAYILADTPVGPDTIYANGRVEKGIKAVYTNVAGFPAPLILTVTPRVAIPASMAGREITFYVVVVNAGQMPPVSSLSELTPDTPSVIQMDKKSKTVSP